MQFVDAVFESARWFLNAASRLVEHAKSSPTSPFHEDLVQHLYSGWALNQGFQNCTENAIGDATKALRGDRSPFAHAVRFGLQAKEIVFPWKREREYRPSGPYLERLATEDLEKIRLCWDEIRASLSALPHPGCDLEDALENERVRFSSLNSTLLHADMKAAILAIDSDTRVPGSQGTPRKGMPLKGWKEIFHAINQQVTKKNQRRWIARLKSYANEIPGCPIQFGGKGKPPQAIDSELVDWWAQVTAAKTAKTVSSDPA